MTEPTSPFGSTAVAAPPTDIEPPADSVDGNAAENRRKLMIVGGIVLVVIVAAAAYFLLFSGGSSTTSSFVSIPQGTPASASKPAAGTPAKSSTKTKAGVSAAGHSASTVTLPKKGKPDVGRNPFTPLVVAPTASVGSGSSTSKSASKSTGIAAASTGTSGASSTVTSPTTSGTTSTGKQTQPVAPRVPVGVELVKVNGTKSATFEVLYNRGTKVETFTVDAPSRSQLSSTGPTVFDTHFGFYSINDSTASVEYDSQSGDNFYTLTMHQVQKLG